MKMLYNETLNAIPLNAIPLNIYKKVCNSCMIYIVLFIVFLITSLCTCVFPLVFKKNNITTVLLDY